MKRFVELCQSFPEVDDDSGLLSIRFFQNVNLPNKIFVRSPDSI